MAGPFMEIKTPYQSDYITRFEDYIILKKLGEGSEGLVFLVRRQNCTRRHVMKIRSRDRGARVLPAEMAIQWDILQHHLKDKRGSSVVKVLDFWWEKPKVSILLTEWCDEGDLRQFINRNLSKRKRYRLPNYLIAHVIAHLLNGLAYLHTGREYDFRKRIWRERPKDWNGGVVHRDIKPENIFIRGCRRTNDDFCLPEFAIGDLGWACPMSEESQMRLEYRTDLPDDAITEPFVPEKLGDPFYVPPEANGPWNRKKAQLSPQTDIYALGLTFHEMMTGLNAVESGKIVEIPSNYDPALISIVMAMVHPDPNKRIRTGELRSLMSQLLKIREYYAPIEKPLPQWSFERWRLKGDIGLNLAPRGVPAGVTGMWEDAAAHRRERGWLEDPGEDAVSSSLGFAIRFIGGSRKRYHRASQDYQAPMSTLDSLRLSIPRSSFFRAGMLETLGASPLADPRRSHNSHDSKRKRQQRKSLPAGKLGPKMANPCPKCCAPKNRHPKKPKRRDSLDFGCAGLQTDELVCICGAVG